MNHFSNIEKISKIYTDEILLAEDFHKLLVAEESALRSRDNEFIQNCLDKKNSLLEKLESMEATRKEAEKILPDSNQSIISEKHTLLKNIFESIQHQNTINAGIVKISHEFSQQLLNIVRGVNNQPSTYDQSGYTENNSKNNQYLAKV